MSTTHVGKIGRLPKNIRHFLGERIEEGIPNKELVEWLNGLQEVKDSLMLRFGGRAITEQNLSEWKQTGHMEWVRREERRALALRLTEQRDEEEMEPEEAAGEKEISDRLGRELGMEMARLAMELVDMEGSIEHRWNRLCGVSRELSQLRQDDHRAARIRIQQERWEREQALQEAASEAQEEARQRQRVVAKVSLPAKVPWLAESFGGGQHGRMMAEVVLRVQAGDPLEEVSEWYQEVQATQARGGKPECARKSKKRTGVRPSMKNGGEAKETPEEAPSTNIQDPEKHQEPNPGAEPTEANSGEAEGVSKTEEIRPNPSESNQIQPENFSTIKESRHEGESE